MRTIIISNYSFKPAKELARVVLDDAGVVSIDGAMQDQLLAGVFDVRTKKPITKDAGAAFIDAILWEFNGAYVRASEVA